MQTRLPVGVFFEPVVVTPGVPAAFQRSTIVVCGHETVVEAPNAALTAPARQPTQLQLVRAGGAPMIVSMRLGRRGFPYQYVDTPTMEPTAWPQMIGVALVTQLPPPERDATTGVVTTPTVSRLAAILAIFVMFFISFFLSLFFAH